MDVVVGDVLPYTQITATLNQTVFSTNWTANAASDVTVYQTPSGDAPDDATQLLQSSQYSVAFIGDSEEVQVTLVTGAGAGDIITIVRATPADYLNLYSNTNFTPSMLNNDFGILTLVDQQAELVNQKIAPRYNYTAEITNVVDTILPLLPANCTWWKNSNNDAISTYELPLDGVAPASAAYVLLSSNATLPNAQALNALGSNSILAWNQGSAQITSTSILGTANQITVTNGTGNGVIGLSIPSNPIMPGSAGMGIPAGNTAARVTPTAPNINLRFNTDTNLIEYYTSGEWVQLSDNGTIAPGLINQLAYYAADGNDISGLATADNAVLVTSAGGVPSLSTTLPSGLTIPGYQPTITGAALTKVDDTNVTLTLGGTPASALLEAVSLTLGWTGDLAISRGGTGVNTVTTAPTASAWAGWDANQNLSANNMLPGFTSTATAGATTTLNVSSSYYQFFTGATTQTVQMPDVTTLVLGQSWYITNSSTGTVTVQSSGGNTIQAMASNSSMIVTCISLSGTTAASWYADYPLNGSSGTVNAGTGNELAYYASNGNAVSGLATGNDGVLVTNGSGVPSISSTLPAGLAATNMSLTTPTLGVATATSVAFSPTTGGIVGTATNDNADAGYVGEVISSHVLFASPVSLTSSTAANITSISLTAGDWDVSGIFRIDYSTNGGEGYGWISTTSAALPDPSLRCGLGLGSGAISPIGGGIGTQRFSVASTTTVYLSAYAAFASGTASACGFIMARRIR